jgi:two-component system, OmpR family, sensor histidine kinase CreC
MHLGVRLLFGFFLITGLAGFFVLRLFTAEIKPSVRQVMEDIMVDTANLLAELAAEELASGEFASANSRFAKQVTRYGQRPVDAQIWGLEKQGLDFRVYVTDAKGVVVFDSNQQALGQDYSQWRDVALTLRGEYGARATREVKSDPKTSVLYVAAPVVFEEKIIGVLTVAKPVATVQAFVDRAEGKILRSGGLLLALSATIGVLVTLWLVLHIRRLKQYADEVQTGRVAHVPIVPGELGELARAMQSMRQRVDGREYVEAYVRALTHELKSPLAAIRGAGELLQEGLPAADQQVFTAEVLSQSVRLQDLVERLLALSKLESRSGLLSSESVSLTDYATGFVARCEQARPLLRFQSHLAVGEMSSVNLEPALIDLSLYNLLDNAQVFSPKTGSIQLLVGEDTITVSDEGGGAPEFALNKLGQKFFATTRPDKSKGSGLGLAICQQIMSLHEGSLRLSNTDKGLAAVLHFPTQ